MLNIIIRTLVLYIIVIISMRLMGKRQLGELQPSELVTTILISNIATLSLEDPTIPMLAGIMPIIMIVCLDVFMSAVTLKSESIRKVVAGSPCVIISNGVINQNALKNLRCTLDDVLEAMREANIFDISTVQYAIVETKGKINFFEQPSDNSAPLNPPSIIIKDGVLNESGLKESGLQREWLKGILNENKVGIKGVFLLTADSDGTFFIVKKQAG